MLFVFHLNLEGIKISLIQKRGLLPLRLLPLMRVLFVPPHWVASENSWCFFEGLQNYMQNKNEANENKIMA